MTNSDLYLHIVTSTPEKRLSASGQSKGSFLAMQFENSRCLTARKPLNTVEWAERFYFDVDLSLNTKQLNPQSKVDNEFRSRSTSSVDEGPSMPRYIASSPNLSVYFLSGKEGSEVICGQKSISIQQLLRSRQYESASNNHADSMQSDSFDSFSDSNAQEVNLDLNSDDSFGDTLKLQ